MRILGIDPGFGRMGFGCVETKGHETVFVAAGVVTTVQTDPFEQRLKQLSQDMETLLKEYHPDVVAVEQLFFAKNSTTAMRVAEARGVVLRTVAVAGMAVNEFTPAQIKKALTGDGLADKRAVQLMVKRLLSLSRVPRPDDAADALAIALTASSGRRAFDKVPVSM